VAPPVEAQVDALVLVPVAEHPVDARVDEQAHAVALQDPRAVGVLDGLGGAVVDDHRLDPGQVQQAREHQPRGAAADDGDLGAGGAGRRHASVSARIRLATPKAVLAAGTPT